MQYFDGTTAAGDLFADTITFDGISVSNITFGCDYTGTNEVGTVGLGGGELSLVRQLGQGSFSYCLVSVTDEKNTSKMSFGSPVAGKGVVSVPLLQRPKTKSFYVVALEGMSFGQTKVDTLSPPVDMILDIGTTMTLLPQGLYDKLKNAVIEWASHKAQLMPVHCPRNWNIDLCFNNTNKDLSASFPGVTVYMGCKAVTLGYNNVLVEVGPSDDGQVFLCMAVMPTPNGVPVYGNLAQTDFLVGVDLVQNTVSFKKTICG
ncbi:Aspartic proteinase CDR1 [Striga hermonthica]|uniref:Aspartic proteinase CDR1 n=1 Tax=Striga hermonthica TaxID=68872 RepID=A0A9N7NY60_STRHE|nr:Aspartic proteinase CDR1 [Striga hermonthica]